MESGEVHKWMYDSYSLKELLKKSGFGDIEIKKCNQSQIHNWQTYKLEVNKDGSEYKPHSLYIEGVKL